MNITLTINAETSAELQEAIAGLSAFAGIVAPQVSVTTEPEKPKKAATKPKAAKVEKTVEPETPADPEPETPEPDEVDIPTVVALRAKAQEVGTTIEKKKAIKALLDKFESKSISEVPEDKRAAFMAALEAL